MITWWLPGYDYDKPNPIQRPTEQAERKARKVGTVKMVASRMASHFVEKLNGQTSHGRTSPQDGDRLTAQRLLR